MVSILQLVKNICPIVKKKMNGKEKNENKKKTVLCFDEK
jgi:hypothetical protein